MKAYWPDLAIAALIAAAIVAIIYLVLGLLILPNRPEADEPAAAGISYALTEAMDEGHCGLPTDELVPLAEELLESPGN